ncbi:hypothetical protein LYNGBM3L_04950 [Moorena producens 3L]|uniref:Uncharacterized protein n=1 Tax=Moorena producens 3L TaxID=489825 RepID=F4XRY5_9CYAN|nr:hypothetical protein LYNGBM3L_04950 [Moorena producens 3L]
MSNWRGFPHERLDQDKAGFIENYPRLPNKMRLPWIERRDRT